RPAARRPRLAWLRPADRHPGRRRRPATGKVAFSWVSPFRVRKSNPSFPRSAWERTSATLCVAPGVRQGAEWPDVRSHAERGNEASPQLPQSQTLRTAARQRLTAVRAEGDAPDLFAVGGAERAQLPVGVGVPGAQHLVGRAVLAAGREDLLAVGAEGDADDGV